MKAMIMAAGLGKRLGGLTRERPKALVEINGKTILQMAVEKVASHGFDDIIVNIHHHAPMMKDQVKMLADLGYRITISDESDCLLETGGGLFKAKWFFGNEPFLIYNADIVTDLDLSRLLGYHNEKKGIATLATRKRKGSRFLLVDSDGILRGWRNRSTGEEILPENPPDELEETGFSGIHMASPELLEYLYDGVYSLTAIYLELAVTGRIFTLRHDDDRWWDIGTPENLDEIRRIYRVS